MTDKENPALDIRNAAVCYANGTMALEGVSLQLNPGEFVAVVGPSGCGKSTLLRLAAGLLSPQVGSVARSAGQVGFVFQDPTLLPWRTARRNVELVAELQGVKRAERRQRAMAALERVGLADVAGQRPNTLSGGMRMRVSLARTLSAQPDLMLFDEPFAAVDEMTRSQLGDDLQRLFLAERFAGLFVTHSVAEAAYLASRVVVMSARPGRIVGEIEVPLAYPRPPQIRFTAEFAQLTAAISELLRSGEDHQPVAPGQYRLDVA